VSYCPECGFKIDGKFNFCPNCGSKLESEFNSQDKSSEQSANLIICKNCGEENSMENSDCFSCGASLIGNRSKRQNKSKQETKKNNNRNTSDVGLKTNKQVINEEKVLDNKKILIISITIVVIFIFALVISGVFEAGVQTEVSQINNQLANSNTGGVKLANMEEINQFENKIKENPDDLESTLHLAHLQQDAGLSEKAIINYKKYLAKFPENADARVDMAICYYNLNDYNTAISEMETAVKYQPKHQIAYLNLGIVNLAAKNLEASKEWFRKTVELDPNSDAGKRAQELLHSH
jgi:tetratricopeptide (TPR) repeat protein